MYKLRSEVELSVSKGKVYLISNNLEDILSNSIKTHYVSMILDSKIFLRDSIFSIIMLRKIYRDLKLNKISDEKFNNLRIQNSIPDFSKDALKNKSLLMEMRFDELNGISWTKGCYMGQEITARMKHRNLQKENYL